VQEGSTSILDDEKIELAETVVRSLVSSGSPDMKEKQLAEAMRRRQEVLSASRS
jgi:hypothetical protein